jgi:hypothetical protein
LAADATQARPRGRPRTVNDDAWVWRSTVRTGAEVPSRWTAHARARTAPRRYRRLPIHPPGVGPSVEAPLRRLNPVEVKCMDNDKRLVLTVTEAARALRISRALADDHRKLPGLDH